MAAMIMWAIAAVLILLGVASALWMSRKKWQRTVDYKTYFNIGLAWLPLGIVMMIAMESAATGIFFFLVGLAYITIGLRHRNKWGKPQKLDPKTVKLLMISIYAGIILLVLGILLFEFLM